VDLWDVQYQFEWAEKILFYVPHDFAHHLFFGQEYGFIDFEYLEARSNI
jgi:hypothetical protein